MNNNINDCCLYIKLYYKQKNYLYVCCSAIIKIGNIVHLPQCTIFCKPLKLRAFKIIHTNITKKSKVLKSK